MTTNQVVRRGSVLLPLAIALLAGCEFAKSADPLNANVAGPMSGVSVQPPMPLSPSNGSVYYDKDQPLTMTMNNPESNSPRPVTVRLQIATDPGFGNPAVSIDGLTPGANGKISYRLNDRLPFGRTYYWRTSADDGANISPWSTPARFDVMQTIVIGQPSPKSPTASARINGLFADLIVTNGTSSGPFGGVDYQFQVSDTSTFANLLTDGVTGQGASGETKYGASGVPDYDHIYYWRARAYDRSNVNNISDWTRIETFMSASAPPPPPPPGSPGTPVPIGNGDWQSCGKQDHGNKLAIVTCVHDAIAPIVGADGAFEVTKRVAWILRNDNPAGGLMIKNGGENITFWRGYSFSSGRMMFSDFNYVKILSDVGGANGASWQEAGPGDPSQYVPAMDPSLPEPIALSFTSTLQNVLANLGLTPPSRTVMTGRALRPASRAIVGLKQN